MPDRMYFQGVLPRKNKEQVVLRVVTALMPDHDSKHSGPKTVVKNTSAFGCFGKNR